MGQYYIPVILKKDFRSYYKEKKAEVVIKPWEYNCGCKLMEHSWVGNDLCRICEGLLANKYYGYPFVWCGDYADDIRVYIFGDANKKYIDDEQEYLPYLFTDGLSERPKFNNELPHYRYIINLSKKQFVDMDKICGNDEQWVIHPLPLLCSSGNGRGSGDYKGINMDKVGIWAYDNIGVVNEIPEGFTELVVHFLESY